jgi:hypothetical protein
MPAKGLSVSLFISLQTKGLSQTEDHAGLGPVAFMPSKEDEAAPHPACRRQMRVLRQEFYCSEVQSAVLFISLQTKGLSQTEEHANLAEAVMKYGKIPYLGQNFSAHQWLTWEWGR